MHALTPAQKHTLEKPLDLDALGELANEYAQENALADYRSRKAKNTRRRQDADLALFAVFINSYEIEVTGKDLREDASSWRGVTWGLVVAFRDWMLSEGYALGSVNVRLSTIKTYAKLATKAGGIDPEEYAKIAMVEGYAHKETERIDERRERLGAGTRRGDKKRKATKLSIHDAELLKAQPLNTAQGRRDTLLMCLLLDHGLRVSELAGLTVEAFDLAAGTFTFYRPKVDNTGTHRMTRDTLQAARTYFEEDAPESGQVLRRSNKGGTLRREGAMSTRALNKRVAYLGQQLGILKLSPHDCRHYAATKYAATKSINELMEIFGWNSPAMAIRYIEAAQVTEVEG